MSKYLHTPVDPPKVTDYNLSGLVQAMGKTAFQGRNVAKSVEVWQNMLEDNVTILLGLAGAMVPAGMRRIIVYLIENRLIDCLVATGANLFHDCHESLGRYHWQGSHLADDTALREEMVDRIYDVFASDLDFQQTDHFIADFAAGLPQDKPYTTRHFLYLLGQELNKTGKENGILTAAARANVPVYCPAVGDSSIGIAMALNRVKGKCNFQFDVIQDVVETAQLIYKTNASGVIYVGGGTPKNYIQQTEVTAYLMGHETQGHKYALQITADAPQWGGLSGCTFEEAQSWGKISAKAMKVSLFADATIVLPLIVNALAEQAEESIKNRTKPQFKIDQAVLEVV
ncbi:MAG: deoxyhypusine synthase [Candidatus Schekmanbacteria bacterium]|nr:deoxyhypusine synthase [Candidatus Schekmanbacteria bacterium]